MTDINKYLLPLDDINLNKVLVNWTWLTGKDKIIIALTKMGDLLLKDNENRLYSLDTGLGELKIICDNYSDFLNGKLTTELYEEIFLSDLVNNLQNSGKTLDNTKVYSFYKLPKLGGEYDTDNIYSVDIYEHYELTAHIHKQIKDLPDGTKIEFKVK